MHNLLLLFQLKWAGRNISLPTAASKKLDSPSKEMKVSEEGHQSDKEVMSKILKELKQASKAEGISQEKLSSPPSRPVHVSPLRVKPSKSSPLPKATKFPTPAVNEPIVPEIPVISEVTSPRASPALSPSN
ncbi:hypothetical protein ACFX1X_022315 [Malus domestica]